MIEPYETVECRLAESSRVRESPCWGRAKGGPLCGLVIPEVAQTRQLP